MKLYTMTSVCMSMKRVEEELESEIWKVLCHKSK